MVSSEHDALRARLAQLDPVPASVPVDPPTSPSARALLERTMLTTEPTPDVATRPRRRTTWLAVAAAAVIAVGIGGAVALSGGDSGSRAQTTLALKVQDSGGGPTMGSCIMFSVDVLKDMPLAFGGTVTEVSAGSVRIAVDHWYKGGDADVVTVAVPPANTSVGTVDFVKGKRYLVTATDGTVNSCGYTGEATPDLVKAFDQAFAP